MPSLYTVESVTCGHPDKVCDQISDAVLDACLVQDPLSRVAVETFGTHGLLVIGGEVTTKAEIDFEQLARKVYREIGYDDSELRVLTHVAQQSREIASGIQDEGAGDQGIMYGYATSETPEFLPLGVVLAHKFAKQLEDLRRSGTVPWLRPDGKTQVTVRDGKIETVLVSTQHDEGVTNEQIAEMVRTYMLEPLGLTDVQLLVNPAGSWTVGGFDADAGLTGRKIMVDNYGGLIPHGGGAFSGKDPSKVDRTGAYMARSVARDLVKQGHADEVFVSVAYAIGRAEPVMVHAHDGEGNDLSAHLGAYDFRPRAMIEYLDLRTPQFRNLAAYGHFGREKF
ncbi:methionine adenosyltransferase [Candidatus Uhrbacteria bacterium CG_4_9_14_3_um_filter_50_9]|uniref:Methionine adenosyltransferase n=1 Tax=Candidatus Uhrbacteria bacterium CG_4_9_14_3_um_filter_50_9 TaxID=1975035 RepID=A0A2M7XC99_9BACT|nr:MAG: methionine adenosyltransferase [Candidatus Uhrbacteria bacterium CG_4_9_14_3_um_filter_50_9]